MSHKLTRIERLDWAAKALGMRQYLSLSTGFWFLYLLLSSWPRWPHVDWWVAITLTSAGLATGMVLLRHRYAILVLSIAQLVIGALFAYAAVTGPRTPSNLVFGSFYSLVWLITGSWLFKKGKHFAAVYDGGWEEELAQLESWLVKLHRSGSDDNVEEVNESTFVRGKRTYRFLKTPDCWAIAVFATGLENKFPVDYRIRELSAVTLENQPDSTLGVRIKGTLIPRGQKVKA